MSAAPRDPAAGRIRRVRLDPWNVEVGPTTHLADERARLAGLEWRHLTVHRMGATIGAEVSGVDLAADLEQPVVDELADALAQYKVLFFDDQHLDAHQHVALARRFGELETHPFIPSNTAEPQLVRFEKEAQVGGYENGWHSDVSWRERPSMGAILRAIEVPAVGGDTLFADMAAAYDGLDPALRQQIDGLHAVHDYVKVFGHQVGKAARAEMRAKYPPVEHPVIRTHPVTGRRILYVNRFFVDHVVGMEREASDALIDQLSRLAETPEHQCRFRWAPGSVAFWDNRAVQHYAASDYWPERRVMERASLVGERPY